jgi:TolA-binding protein
MFASLQAVSVEPIDLTAIVAVVMGLLVILIPIAGLTARFALKPIADAVARMREAQSSSREVAIVEQRLTLLEQQLLHMESEVHRIREATEFDRQLRSGEE